MKSILMRLKRLFAAFEITVLCNKTGNQVTVTATITDAAVQALSGILDPSQVGYYDVSPGGQSSGAERHRYPRPTARCPQLPQPPSIARWSEVEEDHEDPCGGDPHGQGLNRPGETPCAKRDQRDDDGERHPSKLYGNIHGVYTIQSALKSA